MIITMLFVLPRCLLADLLNFDLCVRAHAQAEFPRRFGLPESRHTSLPGSARIQLMATTQKS